MGFALTYASESNPVLPLTRHQLAHKVTAARLISHCYLTVVFSKPERFLGANLTVHALPQSPGFVLVFPTCLYCPVRLMSLLMANYVCVYLETGPVLSFIKYRPPPRSLAPLLPFFLSHASKRELLFLPKAPIFLLTLWRLRWLSSVASSWGAAAFGSDKMPSGGTLSTPAISALLSSRRRAPGRADRGTASTAVQCNSTSAVWCARDSWVPRTGQVCVCVFMCEAIWISTEEVKQGRSARASIEWKLLQSRCFCTFSFQQASTSVWITI